MWKGMAHKYIDMLPTAQGVGHLQASTIFNSSSLVSEEQLLESLLRDKVGSLRMNEEHLGTGWDS